MRISLYIPGSWCNYYVRTGMTPERKWCEMQLPVSYASALKTLLSYDPRKEFFRFIVRNNALKKHPLFDAKNTTRMICQATGPMSLSALVRKHARFLDKTQYEKQQNKRRSERSRLKERQRACKCLQTNLMGVFIFVVCMAVIYFCLFL